uniref:Chitinase PLC-A (Fragments) n=1 Tax=Phytolacca americana TaxID=3527 RepID=Q9S9H9_PHYAM
NFYTRDAFLNAVGSYPDFGTTGSSDDKREIAAFAINGALECNGQNQDEANDRIQFYQKYCADFGVAPGDNLTC